jgi:hypothetical protein
MALITLEQAAGQLHTPPATLEEWVRQGLLKLQFKPSAGLPPGAFQLMTAPPRWVDETAVAELAERIGW